MNPFTITQGWLICLFIITTSSSVYCSIQTFHVVKFQLPIPMGLAIVSTVAPFINFAAQPMGRYFLKAFANDFAGNAARLLNVPLQINMAEDQLAVAEIVTLGLDLALATMAAEKLPHQGCILEQKWKRMFSLKSLGIKDIQTSFECCGFMSTRDRAYPFPDSQHTANACVEQYGYTRPCAPALEEATHRAALTFFLTLLAIILTKISFSYIILRFEIMKSQFPPAIRDIFDEPEAIGWSGAEVTENSRLLANAREHSRSPAVESLIDSVDN